MAGFLFGDCSPFDYRSGFHNRPSTPARGGTGALRIAYPFFTSFAHASFNVTVRLKMNLFSFESLSKQ